VDALCHRHGGIGIAVGQQHQKLLAPIAPQPVGAAQHLARAVGKMHQHRVAMLVASGVVDGLEVVQVHHHDGQAVAITLGALQFLLAVRQQRAAVQRVGQ